DSMVETLTPSRRKLLDDEFPMLMRDFTGLKSKVIQGGDPLTAGQKFAAGQWQLALFQGVEFAWAQAKDPKLQPLLLAINRKKELRALLVVKKDSAAKGVADLEGKDAQVQRGKVHCQLFADKQTKGDAKKFFGKFTVGASVEDALDDVV